MNEDMMPRIPEFEATLKRMLEIHIKKNDDYATSDNPFFNFDVSEYLISLFKNDRDKAFVWPIATKLARLATLLNSDKPPNNESIEDSFDDIANYVVLWKCDMIRSKKEAHRTMVSIVREDMQRGLDELAKKPYSANSS